MPEYDGSERKLTPSLFNAIKQTEQLALHLDKIENGLTITVRCGRQAKTTYLGDESTTDDKMAHGLLEAVCRSVNSMIGDENDRQMSILFEEQWGSPNL